MAKSKKSGKAKTKVKPIQAVPAPVAQASEPMPEVVPARSATIAQPKLRAWNMWMAALHGVQGLAILVLAATHVWPITTNYLASDPIATQIAGKTVMASATKHLFDVNLAVLVAVFFFIAAIAHLLIATKCRAQYERGLARRFSKARWIEYGLSGGTMLVVVGLLSGMSDISSLFMVFVLCVVAAMLGLSVELYAGKTRTILYWLGCAVGLVPWIVLAIYAYGAQTGGGHIPGFLYGIYASMLVLFAATALNLHLAGKKQGRWADYLYAERAFMVLSLVAKAALAWQVFAGALRP